MMLPYTTINPRMYSRQIIPYSGIPFRMYSGQMLPYSSMPAQMYSGQIIPTDRQFFAYPQRVSAPVLEEYPFKCWNSWERSHFLDEIAPARGNYRSITATKRYQGFDQLVFWIGANGSVQGAEWRGDKWKVFQIEPDGSASTTGSITAVSNDEGAVNLLWIGTNGSVQGAESKGYGENWRISQIAPAGSASTTGGITAVSYSNFLRHILWIGANGSVQGIWSENPEPGIYQLAPPGSASTTGSITSVPSGNKLGLEVWWIGANGSVQGASWYEGETVTVKDWGLYQLAPAGNASTTGSITAVSRYEGTIELWWIGSNGSVQGAKWINPETFDKIGHWDIYQLAPAGNASTIGGITSVSRHRGTIELWWIGANGSVQGAKWFEVPIWKLYELAPAGSASTNTSITAVSIGQGGIIDVCWLGATDSVQSAKWVEGGQWKRYVLEPQ